MSQENVKSFAAAAFKARIDAASQQKNSDAEFADIIYTAMTNFGLDDNKFRTAFGLSKGAAERWSQLRNLPQPAVRGGILLWIKENI
jgi:hypothetical protein